MGKAPTKPVSGMRDHRPAAALTRREAFRRVEAAFAAHGFVPLETPAMERLSTLLGKYGEEGDQLIYRVLHRGERLARALDRQPVEPGDLSEFGLRYDLTVPLARVTAEYRAQLPPVFRRYQIQSVWRADRAQRGRFREFTQCDADIVGSSSPVADAETLVVLHAALTALGFSDFTILLNHRELLRALIAASGIPAPSEQETLVVLDKMGKIGREAVVSELGGLAEVGPDRARRLLEQRGHIRDWALEPGGEALRVVHSDLGLLLVEAMRIGILTELRGPELAALVSAFAYEPRRDADEPQGWPTEALEDAWSRLVELAEDLAGTERHHRLPVTRFPHPGFVWLAYAWALRIDLEDLLEEGSLAAGDFVRTTRSVLDLLRQVGDAARVLGNGELGRTAGRARRAIDRGIVTAGGVI